MTNELLPEEIKKLIEKDELSNEQKTRAFLHLFEDFAKRFKGLNYGQIDRETNDKNCSSFPSLILIHFLSFVFHLVPFQILLDLFISCFIFIGQSLHFFDFVNPFRFSFECC